MLSVPSNVTVRRLRAPLEIISDEGVRIVVRNPPEQIEFDIGPIVEFAKQAIGVITSVLGGSSGGSGGAGSGGAGSGGDINVDVDIGDVEVEEGGTININVTVTPPPA
jgi:hypothetical protein